MLRAGDALHRRVIANTGDEGASKQR